MLFPWQRLVMFDKDGGGGDPPDDGSDDDKKDDKSKDKSKDKKPQWTPEQQAELDRRAGAIKTEAADKAKKEAKAEFEAEQQRIKDEAEAASLKEQGKFKELADKSEKDKLAAISEAESAKAEAKELRLQMAFEDAAEDLNYGFVNKTAAKDAFTFLDAKILGDDGAGTKKALEKLKEDRPYLFDGESDSDDAPGTDAKEKGKRPKKEEIDKDKEAALQRRFRAIRKPR